MSPDKKTAALGPRFLSGLRSNLAGQVLVMAVNLATTPIILRRLGTEGYALYTLMWTLMNYLTLLNMGTGNGASAYSARYRFHETSPWGYMVRRVFVFQILAATIGGLGLFFMRDWVARLLCQSSVQALALAPAVFACVALSAPFYFVFQLSSNIIYGMQRFAASSMLGTLQSILVASLASGMLYFGFGGMRQISMIFVASNALLAAVAFALVWNVVKIPSKQPSPEEASDFIRFSLRSQLTLFVVTLISQGDRIFVASLLTLSQMGYYVLASSLAQKFNLLSVTVAAVTFPMFAELHASGQEERLRRFYLKTSELIFFINLPIAILAFVLVPQFMTLWLGIEFSAATTWPFRVILISNLFFLISLLPNNLALGKGHPQLFAIFQAGKALLIMLLWPWLISHWGIMGTAIGVLAGEALAAPIFTGYIHKRFLGVSWGVFWSEACLRPVLASLGLGVLSLATHAYIGNWIVMSAFVVAGLASYFFLSYRLLGAEAKAVLAQWLQSRRLSA